jgi:DNA-binding protein H-NS
METKEPNSKESQVEMFTMQQQLINQYMHLNIQLLSKKLENLEQIEKMTKQEEPSHTPEVKSMKKKMYYYLYSAKKPTTVDIQIGTIMQRECATTATINMVAQRNPGTVLMTSCTLTECAKTATSIPTTASAENNGAKTDLRKTSI